MICIRITEREDGLELFAHGHAGYAPRGQDVVCAGVSALLYGFIAYLEGLLSIATAEALDGTSPRLQVREGDGSLWVETHGLSGRDLDGLGGTLAGLRLITACYPAFVMLETHIYRKGDAHEPN